VLSQENNTLLEKISIPPIPSYFDSPKIKNKNNLDIIKACHVFGVRKLDLGFVKDH
jgi:hypothetical protein